MYKHTPNDSGLLVSYLYLSFIGNYKFTKMYDERDYFNIILILLIVHFWMVLFLVSFAVNISQLVLFALVYG